MDAHDDDDELLALLQARVAERRAAGDYPEGLQRQLEMQFERGMHRAREGAGATDVLDEHIGRLGRVLDGLNVDVAPSSRLPGGTALHAASARLVRRHLQHLAAQMASMGAETRAALEAASDLARAQQRADERDIHDVLTAVMDRLAVVDHLSEMVADLDERVARLERDGRG